MEKPLKQFLIFPGINTYDNKLHGYTVHQQC